MKRTLFAVGLSLAALSLGCGSSQTIKAETPGGSANLAGHVDATGTYALYHVTSTDKFGVPTHYEKVTTVDLQANEQLGFQFVMPKEKQWNPDAKSDVIAYAGSKNWNLGPITSMNEHYYWANPNEWDGYWAGKPERAVLQRLVQY